MTSAEDTTPEPKDNRRKVQDRRSGPRRSEASQAAVQAAAIVELAEHGWRSFSVDRVAKRAKASKQTIYRWWAGPACLVVEAVLETVGPAATDNADPEAAIVDLVQPLINAMRSGDGPHIWRGMLLAAADDEDASEIFRAWMQNHVRQPLRHVLARQANLGHIRRDWDIDFALELLIGPLWQRLLGMRGPVPERYPHRLAQAVMADLRNKTS